VLQLLVKWWSDYPAPLLEQRVVAPMQSYLTKELMATKKLTIGVMNAIKVRKDVTSSPDCATQPLPMGLPVFRVPGYIRLCMSAAESGMHCTTWPLTALHPQ
jgi:hypothetical protein